LPQIFLTPSRTEKPPKSQSLLCLPIEYRSQSLLLLTLLPELDCRFISTLVGEVGEIGEDAVEEALAVLDEEKVR
jgi:hypothetical protein